jgi:hypothetical protein
MRADPPSANIATANEKRATDTITAPRSIRLRRRCRASLKRQSASAPAGSAGELSRTVVSGSSNPIGTELLCLAP